MQIELEGSLYLTNLEALVKKNNPLLDKSYDFALRSVQLCFKIQDSKKEFLLSKQLMRSATSIGANVEEAIGAQSRKDFSHKLSIAYKEARESHYWIRLIYDSGLIPLNIKEEMIFKVEELLKIIGSIHKTLKSN